jgi:hypothetical protein
MGRKKRKKAASGSPTIGRNKGPRELAKRAGIKR